MAAQNYHSECLYNYREYLKFESGTNAGLLSYEGWLETRLISEVRSEAKLQEQITRLRADVDAANARAAAAEAERDALMQAARNVIAWDDKASGNYKGAWEIVADADKLNALNALLYPVTAQPVDGSAAE